MWFGYGPFRWGGGVARWRRARWSIIPTGEVQYACGDYIARPEKNGIVVSRSRLGCPYSTRFSLTSKLPA